MNVLRNFVYGLISSIMIYNRYFYTIDCPTCAVLVAASSNPRETLPSICPRCGRPTSEVIRETYLATQRREARKRESR